MTAAGMGASAFVWSLRSKSIHCDAEAGNSQITAMQSSDAQIASVALRSFTCGLNAKSAASPGAQAELAAVASVMHTAAAPQVQLEALRAISAAVHFGAATQVCEAGCVPALVKCAGGGNNASSWWPSREQEPAKRADTCGEEYKVQMLSLRVLFALVSSQPAGISEHAATIVAGFARNASGVLPFWIYVQKTH